MHYIILRFLDLSTYELALEIHSHWPNLLCLVLLNTFKFTLVSSQCLAKHKHLKLKAHLGSFILDTGLWLLQIAFGSVLNVYPMKRSLRCIGYLCRYRISQVLQIPVIGKNIKSESSPEIPFLNQSNCLSLRFFICVACQNTSFNNALTFQSVQFQLFQKAFEIM